VTPWVGEGIAIEELHCRRYYQPLPASGAGSSVLGALGQKAAGNAIDIPVQLAVPMRANPVLVTNNPSWAGSSPVNNQIGFYSSSASSWLAISGALTVTTAGPASPSSVVLRLQAGTLFSGSIGAVGNLHLGGSVVMALQAEL